MNRVYEWNNGHGYKLRICNEGETSKFHSMIIELIVKYKGEVEHDSILDIGCGKDQLFPDCHTFDLEKPYTRIDIKKLTYTGDAMRLSSYIDRKYSIIYSSHLLEDFENTTEVLNNWKNILEEDGIMVLLLPDQKRYEEKCRILRDIPNNHHKISDFSYDYMLNQCNECGLEVLEGKELFCRDNPFDLEYSFIMVCRVRN